MRVSEGDILQWRPQRQYEVVAANLFADVLQQSFGKIRAALDRGSRLILSGVLREQWEETEVAAREAGLQMKSVTKRGKWVTALGEVAD